MPAALQEMYIHLLLLQFSENYRVSAPAFQAAVGFDCELRQVLVHCFVCAFHLCLLRLDFTLAERQCATATSMSRSIFFFSFHPFANIWSAVLKLHAVRFTTHKKAHYLANWFGLSSHAPKCSTSAM